MGCTHPVACRIRGLWRQKTQCAAIRHPSIERGRLFSKLAFVFMANHADQVTKCQRHSNDQRRKHSLPWERSRSLGPWAEQRHSRTPYVMPFRVAITRRKAGNDNSAPRPGSAILRPAPCGPSDVNGQYHLDCREQRVEPPTCHHQKQSHDGTVEKSEKHVQPTHGIA
jgi:hypothetical protein